MIALAPASSGKDWDLDRSHGPLGSDGESGCLRLSGDSCTFAKSQRGVFGVSERGRKDVTIGVGESRTSNFVVSNITKLLIPGPPPARRSTRCQGYKANATDTSQEPSADFDEGKSPSAWGHRESHLTLDPIRTIFRNILNAYDIIIHYGFPLSGHQV